MKHSYGIQDSEFIRGDIPMTKQEIRTMVMAKANIQPTDIVLDVGAGTGSLSIEAALMASQGMVYAIERETEGAALIAANATKFEVSNIKIITGSAPQAMQGIPPLDVMLVGGSGGHLADILDGGDTLLKAGGRLIITAVTVETLQQGLHCMQQKSNFTIEAFGMQITRIRQLGASNMLQALNPIYIIACTKGGYHDR